METIAAHVTDCPGHGTSNYTESEANQAVGSFSGLSAGQKQDLLNFLRSL